MLDPADREVLALKRDLDNLESWWSALCVAFEGREPSAQANRALKAEIDRFLGRQREGCVVGRLDVRLEWWPGGSDPMSRLVLGLSFQADYAIPSSILDAVRARMQPGLGARVIRQAPLTDGWDDDPLSD